RKKSVPSSPPRDDTPLTRFSQAMNVYTGLTMPKALTSAPKVNATDSAAQSPRRCGSPTPERVPSADSSLPGTRATTPMLPCGQAPTQSMQKVQSKLPTLRGTNRASSQPRRTTGSGWRRSACGAGAGVPVMQSFVAQVAQTAWSRTRTSNGDSAEATKLNCPMGQTHLQNEARWNRLSM